MERTSPSAKAGVQESRNTRDWKAWIPAYAGMTEILFSDGCPAKKTGFLIKLGV